jgi:hypothetical protein
VRRLAICNLAEFRETECPLSARLLCAVADHLLAFSSLPTPQGVRPFSFAIGARL